MSSARPTKIVRPKGSEARAPGNNLFFPVNIDDQYFLFPRCRKPPAELLAPDIREERWKTTYSHYLRPSQRRPVLMLAVLSHGRLIPIMRKNVATPCSSGTLTQTGEGRNYTTWHS